MTTGIVARLLSRLDNPWAWSAVRHGLNFTFGLYRRRFRLLKAWGVLAGAPSVVDIGCGVGQYASITTGPYLGVDSCERYIAHASRRDRRLRHRQYRCVDVAELTAAGKKYNLVLMVDFLHHLPDQTAIALLRTAGRLAETHVVSFEPILEQTNPIGQWIIDHDRGDFIRPLAQLHELYDRAGLPVARSEELYLGPIRSRAVLCRPGAV